MSPQPYTANQLAGALAAVVGELDVESPRLVEPSEIVTALQKLDHLPAELLPGQGHEEHVLSSIMVMRGFQQDSKRRTYQVRRKPSPSGQVLSFEFWQ